MLGRRFAILVVSAGISVIAGYIALWTGVLISTIGITWFIATYAVQLWRGDAQRATAPTGDSTRSSEDRALVRHQSMGWAFQGSEVVGPLCLDDSTPLAASDPVSLAVGSPYDTARDGDVVGVSATAKRIFCPNCQRAYSPDLPVAIETLRREVRDRFRDRLAAPVAEYGITSLVRELSGESVTIDERPLSLAQLLSDLSTICPTWKRRDEIGIALDAKHYQERHPPSPHGWSDVVPLNEILARLASFGLIEDEHRPHIVQEWRDKFPPTWKHSHTAQPDQVLMTFDRSYDVYRLTALGKSVARAVIVR